MESKFLDSLFKSFSAELPELKKMDDYLDLILPEVMPWSEDLYENEYYIDTRWLEIRDSDSFHEAVLHIFRKDGEYLISIDGNISKGKWKILNDSSNAIILDIGNKAELYDRSFLNKDFFILRKHGDQQRKNQRKYFVMARENFVKDLEWREIMELLFTRYRNNSQVIVIATVVVIIVLIIIGFSIF